MICLSRPASGDDWRPDTTRRSLTPCPRGTAPPLRLHQNLQTLQQLLREGLDVTQRSLHALRAWGRYGSRRFCLRRQAAGHPGKLRCSSDEPVRPRFPPCRCRPLERLARARDPSIDGGGENLVDTEGALQSSHHVADISAYPPACRPRRIEEIAFIDARRVGPLERDADGHRSLALPAVAVVRPEADVVDASVGAPAALR